MATETYVAISGGWQSLLTGTVIPVEADGFGIQPLGTSSFGG